MIILIKTKNICPKCGEIVRLGIHILNKNTLYCFNCKLEFLQFSCKCEKVCDNIGDVNRFGETKELCCQCYQHSLHKQEFNQTFDEKYYCKVCQIQLTQQKIQEQRKKEQLHEESISDEKIIII